MNYEMQQRICKVSNCLTRKSKSILRAGFLETLRLLFVLCVSAVEDLGALQPQRRRERRESAESF